MPKPIDLFKLEQILEQAEDFPATARKYFEIAGNVDGRMTIKLRDPDMILAAPPTEDRRVTQYAFADIPGGIAGWLIRREVKNRIAKYRRKRENVDNAVVIVAEGDSWFQHPLLHDLLDYVEREPDFAVLSLASGGSELRQMVQPQDYLIAVKEERPSMFLLSAGGNDFLGNLGQYLIGWKPKPGATSTEYDPNDFINAGFDKLLDQVDDWLTEILNNVLRVSSVERVILHSYDYPIPLPPPSTMPGPILDNRTGTWISGPMNKLKITADYLRARIVHEMLDRYCQRVGNLVLEKRWKDRVRFVDFRKTLSKPQHWFDEIHPNDKQFQTLSKPLIAAIRSV